MIICDLHMPRMNGWDFAERMKSDPDIRAIPLVAVTAEAMVGDRERVLSAGFDGYISKPIDPESFVSTIEALYHISIPQDGAAQCSSSPS